MPVLSIGRQKQRVAVGGDGAQNLVKVVGIGFGAAISSLEGCIQRVVSIIYVKAEYS